MYAVVMLNISLELALSDSAYEDMAIKFLEHFTSIADAINQMSDGFGLWDPQDGFYYDHFHRGEDFFPLRVRSVVGLIPLMACLVLDGKYLEKLPGFRKQLMVHGKQKRSCRTGSLRSTHKVNPTKHRRFIDLSIYRSTHEMKSFMRRHMKTKKYE